MVDKKKEFTPWSSLSSMLGKMPSWWPAEEQQRIASYEKYDQLYWNDPTQYALRILEDEEPLYIPTARQIVDTTASYLMKGLMITPAKGGNAEVLENFLKRERFYSKFNLNKLAGVTRGDSLFHIVADPQKPEGERISIETLHPGMVWKVTDDDDPEKVVRMHVVDQYYLPGDETKKVYIRKLTYEREENESTGQRRITREEAVYELEPKWYGPTPKKVKTILAKEYLDDRITQIPIYWFKNLEWQSQEYGSSDLRGLEYLEWAVSQGATDTQGALGLEGLGVYATDGGRPVDDSGRETNWEVAPGKVMEVPAGSYFRRVEGVGSITPMMDQIKYLEQKMYGATGMTDVALGQVDVQVAQSGIALALKFMPTLAKIEPRDTAHTEVLQQMFYDLDFWFQVYETQSIGAVEVTIDKSKLPADRTATLNELNNMLDRGIISKAFYRLEAKKLGYEIPEGMAAEIQKEKEEEAKLAALTAPPGLQQNAEDAAAGKKPITNANGGNNDNVDNSGNQSNNRNRPNESSGTEATQSAARQAKS